MSKPGFRGFSTIQLTLTVWVALLLATLLFLALQWSLLHMGLILVPLLIVAISVTVATYRNHQAG
jgi:hypothetical protein